MTYPFGEVKIKETDIMPEAFIYKFTHTPTSRWYLGMHGLIEDESHRDGAYWNSSTDEEFKELLQTKPQEFLYEISEYGTVSAIYKKENELLGYSSKDIDLHILKFISLPLYFAIMVIISSIIMFNIPRNKPYIFHILLGILLSVVIYYINNIFNIFGLTNKIPTYLSVFFPIIILSIISSIGLIRINEK